jgi:hypothetical protein
LAQIHTLPVARTPQAPAVRLRGADLVVVAIACGSVMQASAKLLPPPDLVLQSVLVVAWTAMAVRRLLAWRHGRVGPVKVQGVAQGAAIACGLAPWVLLTVMETPLGAESTWAVATAPHSLRLFGACLVVWGVLGPFWLALRRRPPQSDDGADLGQFTMPGADRFAHAAGVFLLLPAAFLGLFSAVWLAVALCVGRARSQDACAVASRLDEAA